ncbi:unnamed protein product [Rhodiola kirilowii]
MATYNFHGGNQEMETTDGLHTLYLMNPNYTTSHHHQQQQQAATNRQNMILLNSSLPHALSHAPPQPQSQFLTIPFAHPISTDDPTRSGNSFHYNLWGSAGGGGQVVEVSSGALGVATATHPYQIQLENDTDMFRRPAVMSPTINQQGLSLSLSSQPRLGGGISGGGGNNGNSYNNNNNSSMSITVVNGSSSSGGGGGFGSTSSAAHQAAVAEDSNGVQNLIMGSKYLKAAQELLDEVVNVGKGSADTTTITANDTVKKEKEKVVQMDNNINGESEAAGNNNEAGGGGGGSNRAASSELTVTQRQELQMKKTKLISMLDEVEQTYRQYNHQMKTVVSSFEQVAGLGSARSYTSLALTTISKQFRCLKDAIMSQIKQISKSLGEEQPGEDCLGVKAEGSRLRMIDHQLRQQRALQQLGMIQHNAWRPQRGLPERAVSVLRAWLFEHFLHPYPKDSDKHILAKRTGLTRNQVSNWFINARVRLWKPMVEEMYLEEVKDQPAEQKGSNSNQDNNNNALVTIAKSSPQQLASNQNADHISNSTTTMSTSPNNNASSFGPPPPPPQGFTLASSDMDGLVQYKKTRGAAVQETTQNNSPSSILSASGEMSFSRQDQSSNLTAKFGAYSTGYDNNNNNNNGGGGFGGAYHQFGDQVGSRFNPNEQLFHHGNNNGSVVSLTLGLPPGENLAHNNNYFSGHGYQMGGNGADGTTDDFCGINNPQNSNMGFQNMDIQNRKNYAAQLLPDFVA